MSRTFAPPLHQPQPPKPAAPAPAAPRVSQPGDAVEREADAAARRALRGSRAAAAPAPPTPPPAEADEGYPLDPAVRGWFEPRFGHSFARVRVHAGARAGASARAFGADAYTVGADLVFAPGRYAPHTPAGRRLLAHELAHVAQPPSSPLVVLRSPAGADPDADDAAQREQEVKDYQAYLNQNQDAEEMPTSRDKAIVLARRRLNGEAVELPENGDALLVIDLLVGEPRPEHREVALRLLNEMEPHVLEGLVSRAQSPGRGKMNVWELTARFPAREMLDVIDVLSRRLHGGFDELLKGTRPLQKADDADLEQQTFEWLEKNRKSAETFFAEAWAAHTVVSLGEQHDTGNVQREFGAAMVKAHGGPGVALAMELSDQAAIDAYMQSGDASKLPSVASRYEGLLREARAKKTHVVASDMAHDEKDYRSPARDTRMAGVVGMEVERSSRKVLYYGGSMHVREWRSHHADPMGRQLAEAHGEQSYAIVMQYEDFPTLNPLVAAMRQRFPDDQTIGFDVDRSPMRWHLDRIHKDPKNDKDYVGKNIDGYIFFLK